MPAQTRPSAAVIEELLDPAYWLVSGLEWHGDGPVSEAAVAVAPGMIPRNTISHDACQILGCTDLYASRHRLRVVFFSDLTQMFADAGASWSQLGVDYNKALQELHAGSFPAIFLAISERMHLNICNPAVGRLILANAATAAGNERGLGRQAITRKLASDGPAYMQRIIDANRIGLAG